MNKRIYEESENDSKSVCYIIIGHGIWVDELAHIFDITKTQKV